MRNIPVATKNLLIVNVLAFVAGMILETRGIDIARLGGLHFFMASDFHLFQLITYQFLHANLSHIFWNMFALWMFGVVMEQVWGPKKFLFYYITCGIGAGLCQELVQYINFSMEGLFAYDYVSLDGVRITLDQYLNQMLTIGASGSVYAILLAFGMTFPNERIFLLLPPIPIKAKWFVIGYAAIELLLTMSSRGDGVAHMAHLGGMLFGFFMIRYWNRHPNSRFNQSNGMQFFENMKRNFERRHGRQAGPQMHAERGGATKEDDMAYNARRKATQDEIDAMLDKIRKSGYDSLTKEEKRRLFEASREQ